MDSGSQPLKNRYECFAQARARGWDQASSWASTFRKDQKIPSNASNRVSGCRAEKRPEVVARIRYLTKERRAEAPDDIPEVFDHAALVALSLEITQALEAALDAAKRSSISNTALTRLKQAFAAHLSRQGKMTDRGSTAPVNRSSAAWDRFYNLDVCSCE